MFVLDDEISLIDMLKPFIRCSTCSRLVLFRIATPRGPDTACGIQHKTGYVAGLIPLEMKIAVGSFKVVHKRWLEFLRFGL